MLDTIPENEVLQVPIQARRQPARPCPPSITTSVTDALLTPVGLSFAVPETPNNSPVYNTCYNPFTLRHRNMSPPLDTIEEVENGVPANEISEESQFPQQVLNSDCEEYRSLIRIYKMEQSIDRWTERRNGIDSARSEHQRVSAAALDENRIRRKRSKKANAAQKNEVADLDRSHVANNAAFEIPTEKEEKRAVLGKWAVKRGIKKFLKKVFFFWHSFEEA